jgi:MoaA/NifB/PqqE/SkfB family radical SAM enzyme
MIIQRTQAYCWNCKTNHPATIEQAGDKIIAICHCPSGRTEYTISSNAEIYLNLYRRFTDRETTLRPTTRAILNYIPITNACNFNCKVCCANVKSGDDATHLAKDEIISRLKSIRSDGGFLVNLFGGEPTLHPDILEIIAAAHKMELNIGIATNGFRLGTDHDFVRRLKSAGLKRAAIHFDSLKDKTLKRLGNDHLETTLRAIENCREYGIRVGLNCTVSEINIHDLTDTMDFALQNVPHVYNMSLLSMAPVGRRENIRDMSVFREDVIREIIKKWEKYGVRLDDIVHLPSFAPWGVWVHPDCGASLMMVKNGKKIYPLNHIIDLEKLFTLMGRCRKTDNKLKAKAIIFSYGLRSLRPRGFARALRLGMSLLWGCRSSGIINFGLTNYKTIYFQDSEKIKHCTCRFYTASGSVKGCHHFAMPDNFKGSIAHQQKNRLL